jgi:hypothetical protein
VLSVVKAVKFVLCKQIIKYNHKTGPRKMKRAVAEVLRGSVMPYESQVWKEEPLQIPPVAASRLAHCSLMDIWYNLYVSVGMINFLSQRSPGQQFPQHI